MAKLQARKLPLQPYNLVEIDYAPEGEACENCGRIVHYVGIVLGKDTEQQHRIGMDCAETLTTASNFDRFNATFKQVKKIVGQLTKFRRERAEDGRLRVYDVENGQTITCVFDEGWQSVLIKIPGDWESSEKSHMIEPREWQKLYHPVRAALASFGVLAPVIPEVLKQVWTNMLPEKP